MFKKVLAIVLSMAMMFSFDAFNFTASADKTEINLKKGTYEPGDVIVTIKDKNIEDSSTKSLASAKKSDEIGDSYGNTMDATGEGKEAAKEADSLAEIIGLSLDDFVIEDSVVFDDMTIVLVHSDSQSTKSMIEDLSANDKVKSVEPNSKIETQAFDSYDCNDPLSSTAYHVNGPKADNASGKSVDPRGISPDDMNSVNASAAWSKLKDDNEVVVAVIDSGVISSHEDLKDNMWTNPGNIGLKGEHGYAFGINSDKDPDYDPVGHGSHCAGIIGATANNGKGTYGVASKANVKIMALSMDVPQEDPALFPAVGAFNYAIKAKEKGVNVVATNCSWSTSAGNSDIYEEVLKKAGEAGILTCVAAGNETMSLDAKTDNPGSAPSEYKVVVGCGTEEGKVAGFSNFGKSTVDLFAPGFNVISTVAYPTFFPAVYDDAKLSELVDYSAEFTKDQTIVNNKITPAKRGDESVHQFGESKFKQQITSDEAVISTMGEGPINIGEATNIIEIDKSTYISNQDNAASLKWTIKDAELGGEYYLYFPYNKNPETTGVDNTQFSCLYQMASKGEKLGVGISVGEVVKNHDGSLEMVGGGAGSAMNEKYDKQSRRLFSAPSEDHPSQILPYSELDGREVGFAVCLHPRANEGWDKGAKHDISFYIDSFGFSKPNIEIKAQNSYELFSGTSMASPATAGAVALLAALDPQDKGQSGADYTRELKSKLLTCVDQKDLLKDLCSSGGQLNLNNIDAAKPSISDAVVDADKKTITLKGLNMSSGVALKYERLNVKGAVPTTIPVNKSDKGMYVQFSTDGKSTTIYNATSLINTHTRFTMENAKGEKASKASFLVKGEKKLTKITSFEAVKSKENGRLNTDDLPKQSLFTDSKGANLFSINTSTGEVQKLVNNKLATLAGTNMMNEFAHSSLLTENYSLYDIENNVRINNSVRNLFAGGDGKVYTVINTNFDEESTYYLCQIDLNKANPAWSFKKLSDQATTDTITESFDDFVYMDGMLYYLKYFYESSEEGITTKTYKGLYSYNISSDTYHYYGDWDVERLNFKLVASNGNLYSMFGSIEKPNTPPEECIGRDIFKFDKQWQKLDTTIPFIGKYSLDIEFPEYFATYAQTKNGPIFFGPSLDGYGNIYIFDTRTDKFVPTYYTEADSFADNLDRSAVATKAGIYMMKPTKGESSSGYALYLLPVSSGAFESIYPDDPKPPVNPVVTKPSKVKVTSAKRKSAKKIKVKFKKVKGAKGYQLAVYKSKKKAKKNKGALVKKTYKKYKKTYTVTSKKFKKKKKLYVKVRAYKLNGKKKLYGAWSKIKKVKKK